MTWIFRILNSILGYITMKYSLYCIYESRVIHLRIMRQVIHPILQVVDASLCHTYYWLIQALYQIQVRDSPI